MSDIEKGFNLRVHECKNNIATAMNNADLPAGVLLMILGTFVPNLQLQDKQAIEADFKLYNEAMKEEKQDGKEIHKD